MFNTVEQFKKQNAYWRDKYYHYAIHKTNGGAMYLFVIEKEKDLRAKDLDYINCLRLDGVDLEQLFNNIKKVKGE